MSMPGLIRPRRDARRQRASLVDGTPSQPHIESEGRDTLEVKQYEIEREAPITQGATDGSVDTL